MPESNSIAVQPARGNAAPAPELVLSTWFWRVMAVLMFCALTLVGWVAWNLMPRSVVTEAAFLARQHSGRLALVPPGSPSGSASRPASTTAAAPAHGRTAVGGISQGPMTAPDAAVSSPETPKAPEIAAGELQQTYRQAPDMLRLETRINTPINEREGTAAPAGARANSQAGKASNGNTLPAR